MLFFGILTIMSMFIDTKSKRTDTYIYYARKM